MKVIGLISGTSMDGIDAALTDIHGQPPDIAIQLLTYRLFPYPPGLRERIRNLPSQGCVKDVCHLNAYLGELFAQAANQLIEEAKINRSEIKLIGSHGQTVYHQPDPIREFDPPQTFYIRSSLQIGEASIIAERTGITTISNFRMRDMAAGGVGAPLLPYCHFLIFGDQKRNRIVINIGGLANITVLPSGKNLQKITAFDTGPGNIIIDGLIQRISGSTLQYDKDGAIARSGKLSQPLFDFLLQHPFYFQLPPKAGERNQFGDSYLRGILKQAEKLKISFTDLIHTVTTSVAESICRQYQKFILPECPADDVIICGGGALNRFLVDCLIHKFPNSRVITSDQLGINSKAVEAIGFALLAYETWHNRPGNLPTVTGATKPVILGAITP